MAFESCVVHPKRDWFFHIRLDYFGITGEDHCSAAVLYVFEFVTNRILEQMEKEGMSGEPWVLISKRQLSDSLIGLFSPRSIQNSLQSLTAYGFISRRDGVDGGVCEYLFHYQKVSDSVQEWASSTPGKIARGRFHGYAGRIADPPKQNKPTPPSRIADPPEQNCSSLNKEFNNLKEQEEKETPIIPTPEFDLQPGTTVLEFTQNAYRQSRGAKFPNKTELARFRIPERISELESSYGIEEFRTELWSYLGQSSDWLRQNKWPIAGFLKNMESVGGSYRTDRVFKTNPPIQCELPGTEPPVCPTLDIRAIAAQYHEIAPHAPGFILSSGNPDFPALHDPEFFRRMDEIFRKMESLWVTGNTKDISWLNLAWVMRSKGGLLNWNALMMGTLDGMVRGDSAGRKSGLSPIETADLKTRTLALIKKKGEERDAAVRAKG